MKLNNIIIFFLLITSCNKRDPSSEKQPHNLDGIRIELGGQRIVFTMENDSVTSLIFSFVQTANSFSPDQSKTRKHRFVLDKSEKKEIVNLIEGLLNNPPTAQSYCTDYVGNISFSHIEGQVTRTCTYNSICSWKDLPESAKKIMDILQKKTLLNN